MVFPRTCTARFPSPSGLLLLAALWLPLPAWPQATGELAELRARQLAAEARQALAEAERAELLARLPPAQSKPLAGAVDTRQFGAAGLVRAFDLARELAATLCARLPAGRATALYEPVTAQGMVAARTVDSALVRLSSDMAERNKELQRYLDTHRPPGTGTAAIPLAVLTVVPATVRAGADIAALLRSDVSAAGIGYGEGARSLFASALAQACPGRISGLGAGYLGELDWPRYEKLLGRVSALAVHRAAYAQRIGALQLLADAAKGEQKKEFAVVAQAALAQLKVVDAFVESIKAGEASEKSPLFNTARYLGYSERTAGSLLLDIDLRLEGMSIVKENLFTGQHLRLSGVAFLWYRLHEPDGRLLEADVLRRITRPVEVDLRGSSPDTFWSGP
ncbi:hypothetical protein [Massilia yuzhufengensis]|uniref:Uncharacterized protein n=1 Tax=Massilia yuzhufengensis TaxID=1164594 RepID=A0A1I1MGB8_9BURK|nr:hypothetical protein [Massilia yuzhufengensis]SFC84514.1 hypothetical protein SAMN05216204_11127 [Massilia yuzhufengensis]